jgi:hypothetical protein
MKGKEKAAHAYFSGALVLMFDDILFSLISWNAGMHPNYVEKMEPFFPWRSGKMQPVIFTETSCFHFIYKYTRQSLYTAKLYIYIYI